MSDRHEIERQLEAWADAEVRPVDGTFANRLDAHLRDLARDRPDPGRRPVWQPALLGLLALAIVGVGLFAWNRRGGDDVTLVMGANVDTQVVLPDGEAMGAAEGLDLPDGTRISVGPSGSAVVGDVVLTSDSEALVVDGTLEIITDRNPTSPTSAPARTSSTTESPTTRVPTSRPPTTRPGGDGSTTSQRTTTTTGTGPTTGPSSTDTDRPTDRPTTTTTAPMVELTATAGRDGLVQLSWTYTGPDNVAGWEIVAIAGDRTRTLALVRDPAARSITVDGADRPVAHRVIARTAEGEVVAESNIVETR